MSNEELEKNGSKEENNTSKQQKSKGKDSLLKDVLNMVLYCAVIIVAAVLIVTFVAQRTEVIGESMCDTLQNGDNLIVDKLTYRFTSPKRYDIIVFPSPDEPGKNYIKRIIGLPGETVQIIDGEVYINGELLGENYGREVMEYYGTAQEPITLGENEYFVLGDNRNKSKDSRYEAVGNISGEDILGRAWLRIWPLKSFGILKHS